MVKIILLIIWLVGIIPSWLWIKKNTDIDWIGRSIMSIGSWGLVILYIGDLIYKYIRYKK